MMLSGKRRRDRANQSEKRWKPRGEQTIRVGLMIGLLGLLTILFPTQQSYEYNAFREGTIAQEEVIAPETFSVHKNGDQYQQEVAESRRNIPPVLRYDNTLQPHKQEAFAKFLKTVKEQSGTVLTDSLAQALRLAHPEIGPISTSTLNFLLPLPKHLSPTRAQLLATVDSILQNTYQNGILANKSDLSKEDHNEVTLIRNGSEDQSPLSQLVDIEVFTHSLQQTIEQQLPEAESIEIKSGYELVVAYLEPNITYDPEETHKRREEAASNVSTTKGTVLQGERIVDEHDRITSEHIDKLESLVEHVNQRRMEDPFISIIQRGASTTLCALILAIFFGYLNLFRPPLYRQTSHIVLFGIILLMPTAVAYYASQSDIVSPFLVPVALSAMLATVLFDAEIGMVITLAATALCSCILGELQYGIVFLITGIIGAFSVRQVRHRRDFYRSIVYLILAYALTISATVGVLFTYADTSEFAIQVRQDLLIGIFSACASSILTIGLLPIFESIFSVVTPITLLELSDLNRPLLRNLAICAPGTYSHSMNMANISEAAATAIDADPLLVRVGCYYHDIGKMIRPHYFIENQKGLNPHDELQPKMSALILISHVKDGIELAEEEGLPRAIVDLIPQHHGTSEIASFKHRAEQSGKQAVQDADFRYPGPKPQTKEAGIINLADAVESATRSLPNNDPDQIKGLVQIIVKGRFTAGELDECDLTLRDLTKIQEAFLPVLQASRHHRVPYPWQIKEQEERSRRREGKERL